MSPIILNLLPPEHQDIFVIRQRSRIAVRIFIAALFLVVILDVLLLNSVLFLRESSSGEKELLASSELKAGQATTEILGKRIRDIEAIVEGAGGAVGGETPHATLNLLYIAKLFPEKVYLKTIVYNIETGAMTLTAFAPTPEEVLEFGERLRNDPRVTDLDYPISNLASRENITLRTSFTLMPES